MDFSFIISIITGIFTYVLIQVSVKVFNNFIIPWYQSIVYQGIIIEGQWTGFKAKVQGDTYIQGEESDITINLKQKVNKITGELSLINNKGVIGQEKTKIFKISGLFYDNNLIVNLKTKDRNKMGGGVCVMKLTEDGSKLKGKRIHISSHNALTIFDVDEIWIRNNVV